MNGTIRGDSTATTTVETTMTNHQNPKAAPYPAPSATADSGHPPYGPTAAPPGLSAAPGAPSPCPTCLGTGIGVDLLPCLDC